MKHLIYILIIAALAGCSDKPPEHVERKVIGQDFRFSEDRIHPPLLYTFKDGEAEITAKTYYNDRWHMTYVHLTRNRMRCVEAPYILFKPDKEKTVTRIRYAINGTIFTKYAIDNITTRETNISFTDALDGKSYKVNTGYETCEFEATLKEPLLPETAAVVAKRKIQAEAFLKEVNSWELDKDQQPFGFHEEYNYGALTY